MANPSTIQAVAERADFGPAYAGEDFVTLTFRVPKSTGAIPGIWELTPVRPGTLDWATSKTDYSPDGEGHSR